MDSFNVFIITVIIVIAFNMIVIKFNPDVSQIQHVTVQNKVNSLLVAAKPRLLEDLCRVLKEMHLQIASRFTTWFLV